MRTEAQIHVVFFKVDRTFKYDGVNFRNVSFLERQLGSEGFFGNNWLDI